MYNYKTEAAQFLSKNADSLNALSVDQISDMLEIPPDKKMGDYAFPCFRLAKQFRKAPALIAQDVAAHLKEEDLFEQVEAVGPYVNVFVNKEKIVELVRDAFASQEQFGSSQNRILMIELIKAGSQCDCKPCDDIRLISLCCLMYLFRKLLYDL